MEVTLTSEQQAFVQLAVENGRVQNEEEAVRQALTLWEDRERARLEFVLALDRAEASLARGEGRTFTSEEDIRVYAELVKERGKARLASSQMKAG
jgi:Arc/MetJ-type ribon-helix-helix transcriptional regulator